MRHRSTTVIVIGAGHAGLATSRCLTDRSIDHVVLERGRVAERWRTERWDSLRLLTPNWQTRLPGRSYRGRDPEGFMTMPEVISLLTTYAAESGAPVEERTTVTSVARNGDGFVVSTDRGSWAAPNVVVATGPFHHPRVPADAARVHPTIAQTTTSTYRRPEQLPDGGVLVVGASASGVQLAHELRTAGRDVVLAVGSHTFLPRRYRGMDIQWWLEEIGALDDRPAAGAPDHSLQLVADEEGRSLGLRRLQALGVVLAGRLTGLDSRAASFADDLAATCAAAERRLERVLGRIDDHIGASGLETEVDGAERPAALQVPPPLPQLTFSAAGVTSILWATGYRRSYPWLHVPVLDGNGEIRHNGGVTDVPGMYAIGLPNLRTRKSTFIDGVGADAAAIVQHLAGRLAGCADGRTPDDVPWAS